ncbi:hypothetical protein PDENDC454_14722 [Paenibacillus dendritiformis C454]|uniref:Uncharacterized protein n=1 Tax=Paenibacillus dendritiformis C454 TaxID=1131935 RepID=H3SHD1_9BACL|nr:hypothetical protein PDENDC454_14722 [Paenibacillus dendritiformis C454]
MILRQELDLFIRQIPRVRAALFIGFAAIGAGEPAKNYFQKFIFLEGIIMFCRIMYTCTNNLCINS